MQPAKSAHAALCRKQDTARSNAVVKKYDMHYHIDKRSFPGGSIRYGGTACGLLGTHMGQCTDDAEDAKPWKENGQYMKRADYSE